MFNRKQKEIDRLNARCVDLARMLTEKAKDLKIAKSNNYLILEENYKASQENNSLKSKLKLINNLMTCNQYDNGTALKSKIIELTSDYQSIS